MMFSLRILRSSATKISEMASSIYERSSSVLLLTSGPLLGFPKKHIINVITKRSNRADSGQTASQDHFLSGNVNFKGQQEAVIHGKAAQASSKPIQVTLATRFPPLNTGETEVYILLLLLLPPFGDPSKS